MDSLGPMRSGPSWVATVVTVVGFALLAAAGLLYLASGLVVPLPWTPFLWAVWLALAAWAVVSRRRPGVVLAAPVIAVVAWIAIVSAGSVLFDWSA